MFNMKNYFISIAPIVKGDKFSLPQCPKNSLELESIKNILYVYVVGSLVYLEICTRLDIAFALGIMGRYQSNLGIWQLLRKACNIFKEQRIACLHIENSIIKIWSDIQMLTLQADLIRGSLFHATSL